MQGFLNLNKPIGWTSHDCVAKVRRLLQTKKVGHAGTLDPAATGVLPIAIGRATRLLQYLSSDKAYRATVRFGLSTATDDLEGDVLTQQSAKHLTLDSIKAVLPQFLGTIEQIPPRYSAIQVDGKRLYDLARAGKDVEVPRRTVTVYDIQIGDWRPGDQPELDLDIACGAGTYIRAIARDLGEILGTGATLAALNRTLSSGFELTNSLSLDQLAEQLAANAWSPIAADAGLAHLPRITLPDSEAQRWCQGQKIQVTDFDLYPDGIYRIYSETDQFLGISETQVSDQSDQRLRLRPKVVLGLD